ncbi:ABC transporter ATP-binding protein [Xylophilus sp. GW821-FHT01B05]
MPHHTPPATGTLHARQLRGRLPGSFDLDLHPGKCTVLTGPSGSGKSLLLRMLADLDPNTGDVRIGNQTRDSMPAAVWRRQVGYVPADAGWWADMVGAHFDPPSAARELLPTVGLRPELLDAPVAQLSTGERQRMALLRAITRQPRFLLLDEPTSALDADSVALVEALLQRLRSEGMGLLVVSHDPAQAQRLADRHLKLTPTGLEAAT